MDEAPISQDDTPYKPVKILSFGRDGSYLEVGGLSFLHGVDHGSGDAVNGLVDISFRYTTTGGRWW